MPTRIVYLVRHGQEDKQSRTGPHGGNLTQLGVKQAQATAALLQSIPFTAIYTSTLRRAWQTAGYILEEHPGLSLTRTNLLWETTPAIPPEVQEGLGRAAQRMVLEEEARIARAFSRYFKEPDGDSEQHVLLVCHGNLIRYFVCRVLGISPRQWVHLGMSNCGLSTVEVQIGGHKVLLSHNETSHLIPELLSGR